jgi:cytochrome P450
MKATTSQAAASGGAGAQPADRRTRADAPGPPTDLNGSSPGGSGVSRRTGATTPIVSLRPAWPQTGLPPGPRTPSLVHQLAFWNRREAFLLRCRARYGSRFTLRLRVPSVPFVVLSSPGDLREMFLAPPDILYAGDGSAELEKYFGQTGLTFMEENEHLTRRKVINRSTHGDAVKGMVASMSDMVAREVASWRRDEVIELYPSIHRLAVKAMCLVCFGPQKDRRLDELVDVHLDMMRFGDSLLSFTQIHSLPPNAVRLLTAIRPLGFHRFFGLRARANELIRDVVEERRQAGPDGEGLDMVSVLLSTTYEDGSPLSWVDVRDEIVTTFVAGSESTAATLAFAIERLAHEHGIRRRLLDEIEAGEDDAYLTATFHEILRLKPTVPIIPRLVMKPFEVGGLRLQPGVRLFGAPLLTHTDPSIYPEPFAFRPDRFLEQGPGTYTWVPFGGGRRRCLGKVVAELEVKNVLREVLTRYEVRPEAAQPERIRPRTVVYVPGRGLLVTLSERTPRPARAPEPSTAAA